MGISSSPFFLFYFIVGFPLKLRTLRHSIDVLFCGFSFYASSGLMNNFFHVGFVRKL